MGAVAVDLENFDGAIRGARGETTTVKIELSIMDHIGMVGVDERFGRDLKEKIMIRLKVFAIAEREVERVIGKVWGDLPFVGC